MVKVISFSFITVWTLYIARLHFGGVLCYSDVMYMKKKKKKTIKGRRKKKGY